MYSSVYLDCILGRFHDIIKIRQFGGSKVNLGKHGYWVHTYYNIILEYKISFPEQCSC